MANTAATTRTLWDKTAKDQIWQALPTFAMLLEHKRQKVSGTAITHTVSIATHESLFQAYGTNTPLTSGDKTILDKAEWLWKLAQVPVEYSVTEMIQNQGADKATAPIDLIRAKVESCQEGMRRGLNARVWAVPATPYEGAALEDFQGIQSALLHDIVYGGISRTIATPLNTYWQGASLAGTFADVATAMTPSIANVQKMARICLRYRKPNEKLYLFCDENNYAALKAQVQASIVYPKDGTPNLMKYGFSTFMIDNTEVVCDNWLNTNAAAATTYKYMAMLNPETWYLHISPERNMTLTPFKWQGEAVNGLDKYVARAMVAGNLLCTQPNANMFKSNVS